MTNPTDSRVREAISEAVYEAIAIVGIDGLRRTSMFPSAAKRAELPLAA